MTRSTALTTYVTACALQVYHAPRSLPRYDLPAGVFVLWRAEIPISGVAP